MKTNNQKFMWLERRGKTWAWKAWKLFYSLWKFTSKIKGPRYPEYLFKGCSFRDIPSLRIYGGKGGRLALVPTKSQPTLHCKRKWASFPSPARMSLTKLSLGGKNDVMYKLCLPGESLASDIPAEDGNIANFFLQCMNFGHDLKICCISFKKEQ